MTASTAPVLAASRLLGQLLLARAAIQPAELEAALAEQRACRDRLGTILVRHGADPETIGRALADQLHLEFAPAPLQPAADAIALVDGDLAARLRIMPLVLHGARLRTAMADPLDANALDDLRFRTGRRIDPVVATPAAIDTALAVYHTQAVDAILARIAAPTPPSAQAKQTAESPELAALRRASEAAPIVAVVDHVLSRAVRMRGSDVHLEPEPDGLRVRVRVDGSLRHVLTLPRNTALAIASRIKIMADLDIAVKRRPQDGRASLAVDGRNLSFRISTLPANGAEKIVLRILDPDGAAQPLDALGMEPHTDATFRSLLQASHGVILVTGPTGSGKTTTLYGALSTLDREHRNIITLEDPVEYRLPGITQVQVHRRAGLGFAAALRAVLRQDPDVIMVGELRDRETVETAMAAALTGHLVLSTLHTNDAPSATTRLTDMGAPPWLIASALIGVLAQRLARRLCPDCARSGPVDRADLARLGLPDNPTELHRPDGCDRCDHAGFRGRTGIFELMPVSPEIRNLILKRAPVDSIRRTAADLGMSSLAQDAWRNVAAGLTSIDEVRPLLSLLSRDSTLCPLCHTPTRPTFLHCPTCGSALSPRCPCGSRLHPSWHHCTRCGKQTPP